MDMKRGFGFPEGLVLVGLLLVYFMGIYPLLSPITATFVTDDPFLGFLVNCMPIAFLAAIINGASL